VVLLYINVSDIFDKIRQNEHEKFKDSEGELVEEGVEFQKKKGTSKKFNP
jgi:hypothetical protein